MDVNKHPHEHSDAFVVLACDGVWDVMSNQEVVNFLAESLGFTGELVLICYLIVLGSIINMFIIA
jgi:protein phosphatase PTC2/3